MRSLGWFLVLLSALGSVATAPHPVIPANSHQIATVMTTEPNGPLPPQPM